MNTIITPPDNIKAIFPIKGNEAKITEAAITYGIVVYPDLNIALFEGTVKELTDIKCMLTGGVKS